LFVSTGSHCFLDSFFLAIIHTAILWGDPLMLKYCRGLRLRHWARYSFFSLLSYIYTILHCPNCAIWGIWTVDVKISNFGD
jgi:hypothetical protein